MLEPVKGKWDILEILVWAIGESGRAKRAGWLELHWIGIKIMSSDLKLAEAR